MALVGYFFHEFEICCSILEIYLITGRRVPVQVQCCSRLNRGRIPCGTINQVSDRLCWKNHECLFGHYKEKRNVRLNMEICKVMSFGNGVKGCWFALKMAQITVLLENISFRIAKRPPASGGIIRVLANGYKGTCHCRQSIIASIAKFPHGTPMRS